MWRSSIYTFIDVEVYDLYIYRCGGLLSMCGELVEDSECCDGFVCVSTEWEGRVKN